MTANNNNQKEFEKVLDQYMNDLADEIFAKSQNNLIDDGKIDTATMLKTANINRQYLKKEIVYPAPYAEAVHFGRVRGSMPPVEPLEKWARRKLRAANPKQAAFAIAKSIEKRGIEPTPFLQDAIDDVMTNEGI